MTAKRGPHVFEEAGLGKAPFRFIGQYDRVGPEPILNKDGRPSGLTCGAPGQPMGSCDYCGTGIKTCCEIKSSDGRIFVVGIDCVRKTGDAGLKRIVNEIRKKQRHEREATRIFAAQDRLPELREQLEARPHPNKKMAGEGKTLWDYADWMMAHAGTAGKLRIARLIEKALKPA